MAGFSYGSAAPRVGKTSGGIIANAMQPRAAIKAVIKAKRSAPAKRRKR